MGIAATRHLAMTFRQLGGRHQAAGHGRRGAASRCRGQGDSRVDSSGQARRCRPGVTSRTGAGPASDREERPAGSSMYSRCLPLGHTCQSQREAACPHSIGGGSIGQPDRGMAADKQPAGSNMQHVSCLSSARPGPASAEQPSSSTQGVSVYQPDHGMAADGQPARS